MSSIPEKMKALIAGWRDVFAQPELPFYFVQIAPYNYGNNVKSGLGKVNEYNKRQGLNRRINVDTQAANDLMTGNMDWMNATVSPSVEGRADPASTGVAEYAVPQTEEDITQVRWMTPDEARAAAATSHGRLRCRRRRMIMSRHASELSNWILDESFSGHRRAMYAELMTPRLIVLDDYGKERMQTDVVREAMVTAIERWTSNRRFLIVTTNIAADEDMIRHEPANASRLDALPEIILPPLDRRGAFKGE